MMMMLRDAFNTLLKRHNITCNNNTVHNMSMRHQYQHQSSFKQLWCEAVAPLVMDAFAIYLWATPLTTSLVSRAPLGSIGTTVAIAFLVFIGNMVIHPRRCIHFHAKTNIAENPLFRALWLYTCADAVSHSTGGTGAVMSFTIVVFLPLIYARVPASLAACSALYATAFFVLTIARAVVIQVEPPESSSFIGGGVLNSTLQSTLDSTLQSTLDSTLQSTLDSTL